MSYGTVDPVGDPGLGVQAGAENRTGTSGKNLSPVVLNTNHTIVMGPPQAGGVRTFTYSGVGRKVGTYQILADYLSNVTLGHTQQFVTITVTEP
jgi:hypothetical protein